MRKSVGANLPTTLWIRPGNKTTYYVLGAGLCDIRAVTTALQFGQVCWVEHIDQQKKEVVAYFAAVIQTQNQALQNAKVKYLDEIDAVTEVHMKHLLLRSDETKTNVMNIDDLVNLPLLNEAELVHSIKIRFMRDRIFSYIGDTLIIVNPFEELPYLFNPSMLSHFQACAKNPVFNIQSEQPHIYAIAAIAYKQLFESNKAQTIVISGESGTGKTVNTKYCMSLIASMKGDGGSNIKGGGSRISRSSHLEQLIVQCNPILEAFGNAKTIKNDNSSRFGKFVNIYFDMSTHKIIGARTKSYLLEKSRVIHQSKEERNYHVFYCLLQSQETALLERIWLKEVGRQVKASEFAYLSRADSAFVDSIDDTSMFREIVASINLMNISEEDQECIWMIVASVLHLGNLEFIEQTSEQQCCTIIEKNLNKTSRIDAVSKIAKLLGVSHVKLRETILNKTIKVGGSEISSPLIRSEVISSVQTVSKDLYNKLFQWLILAMNKRLMQETSDYELQRLLAHQHAQSLGLLDIFGFEVLQINSFEQLCINYANEVLQQLYIEQIFKSESVEFEAQGLSDQFSQLPYSDNVEVIGLLDRPTVGIFSLIDDNSALPATEESLLNKMNETHKQSQLYTLPRTKGDLFTINHTPRPVTYTITGFRQKNKDEMNKSMIELFSTSTNPIVVAVYSLESDINAPIQLKPKQQGVLVSQNLMNAAKDKFLGYKFRKQIGELMQELRASDIHFIRCIKPNETKSAKVFSEDIVINQLRYLGVLDSVKIRKEGFPYRKEYKQFYRKFGEIEPTNRQTFEELERKKSNFALLVQIMSIWKDKGFITSDGSDDAKKRVLFGKTKVFMRSNAIEELEALYTERMSDNIVAAIVIQKSMRRFLAKRVVQAKRVKVNRLTRWLKSRAVRLIFLRKRNSCLTIQRFHRRKVFKAMRRRTIVFQKYVKRTVGIRKYYEQMKLVVKLQRSIREALVKWKERNYRHFKRAMVVKSFELAWRRITHRSAVLVQKLVRGFLVREVYQRENIVRRKNLIRNWRRFRAAVKIQKVVRGYLGRKLVRQRWLSSTKIQGYVRSKWLVGMLTNMRLAATRIQKHYRTHYEKTRPMREYLRAQDRLLANLSTVEQHSLVSSKLMLSEQQRQASNSAATHVDSKENRLMRDLSISSDKKITFFTLLVDFEVLSDTSDIYDPHWNKQFSQLTRDLFALNHDVTQISIGEAHSLASATNGKVYGWGWNDYGQINVNPIVQEDESQLNSNNAAGAHKRPTAISWIENINRAKVIATGSDHTFILDSENNLYATGRNNIGQLGLGHNENVVIPERVDIRLRQDDMIKIVKTRYEQSVIVTEKGTAWIWPIQQSADTMIFEPFELAFPVPRITVASASCGLNFSIFLSTSGLVFSLGSNRNGELGLGDTDNRNVPCLIEQLKLSGDQIVSVECGQKHSIARSFMSRVFTWGQGAKGQLGHGIRLDELIPKQVGLPRARVLQVQAGCKSSLVLLEGKKILWWGQNSRLDSQEIPVEMDLTAIDGNIDWQSDQSDFHPVRIETTWSRSLSLTYVKYADTRGFDQNTSFKNKLISTLIAKWQESFLNTCDVPFFDSISKHFSNRHVVKHSVVRCRQGPRYPSSGTDKYMIVSKSTRGHPDDLLRSRPASQQQTSHTTNKNDITFSQNANNSVFNNFIRKAGQLKEQSNAIISPKKNQDSEDENLLDSFQVSPNSLLEKYKTDKEQSVSSHSPNIRISQFLDMPLSKMSSIQSLTGVGQGTGGQTSRPSQQLQSQPPIATTSSGLFSNVISQLTSQQAQQDESPAEVTPSSHLKNLSKVKSKLQVTFKEKGHLFNFGASNQSEPMTSQRTKASSNASSNPPSHRSDQLQVLMKQMKEKQSPSKLDIRAQLEGTTSAYDDSLLKSLQLKLSGIKARMKVLTHIPKNEWTIDDNLFMAEVSDSKMIDFFKSISNA